MALKSTAVVSKDDGAVALYFSLNENEKVDLEVAALAVIEWARAIKAAAFAIDSEYEYRVGLIAAEPGSSRWLASVERSPINKGAERLQRGWEQLPLILRWTIALGVVIPGTAVPTAKYWIGGEEKFSNSQIHQIEEAVKKVADDPSVKAHKQSMYKKLPRDKNITGIGAGVAQIPNWKPQYTVPSNQFAEADGLFEVQPEAEKERIIPLEIDAILVSPRLQNAARSWEFRQEGIPGTFKAIMKDDEFLAALERKSVRETFRSDIPMTIRMKIKQRLVDGEWKVVPRGRVIVKVISPVSE